MKNEATLFIDEKIASLDDWRGTTLARVRELIHAADADVVEEVKWRGVPVWSHGGILCTGETYKAAVKLTFAKGPRCRTRRVCSTRVLKATRGGRLICMKGKRWTRWRSRR